MTAKITATTDRRTILAALAQSRAELRHWRQREVDRETQLHLRNGKRATTETDEQVAFRIAAQIELCRLPKDPNAADHRRVLRNELNNWKATP